jgi:hypothetical protein
MAGPSEAEMAAVMEAVEARLAGASTVLAITR